MDRSQLPKVAIDLDEVVFPFMEGINAHYNRLFGTSYKVSDYHDYNLEAVWDQPKNRVDQIIREFLSGDVRHLQPMDGAVMGLKVLEQEFQMAAVSMRDGLSTIVQATQRYLQHHGADVFDLGIHLCGNRHLGTPHRSKLDVCRALGAQYLLDDHPQNVLACAAGGMYCVLHGTMPHSRLEGPIPERVYVAKDWPESTAMLLRLKQETQG